MQHAADVGGWTRFISMQDQYNLIQREEEREMHPLALDQGVGVLPWSPLARGKLARPWGESTARSESDEFGKSLYSQAEESDRAIIGELSRIAEQRGVPQARVALAWVRHQAPVTAPIVGVTKQRHLDDALASLDIELTSDELASLAEPYTPRWPEGF
jgi:aryl-alcohol dehydrogenase (NADP+)